MEWDVDASELTAQCGKCGCRRASKVEFAPTLIVIEASDSSDGHTLMEDGKELLAAGRFEEAAAQLERVLLKLSDVGSLAPDWRLHSIILGSPMPRATALNWRSQHSRRT